MLDDEWRLHTPPSYKTNNFPIPLSFCLCPFKFNSNNIPFQNSVLFNWYTSISYGLLFLFSFMGLGYSYTTFFFITLQIFQSLIINWKVTCVFHVEVHLTYILSPIRSRQLSRTHFPKNESEPPTWLSLMFLVHLFLIINWPY